MPVSDLFPHVAGCVDDLASSARWSSNFSEHTNANYFLHTGIGQQGRPSMGAWVTLRPGQRVPGPARLRRPQRRPDPARRAGQLQQRLPARRLPGLDLPAAATRPVANIQPTEASDRAAARQARPARASSTGRARAARPATTSSKSAIANYELAFRMQTAVPELMDLERRDRRRRGGSTASTDVRPTRIFGPQCLLARRLVERGVRFVELTCPRRRRRPLGPARQPQEGPREQRPRRRPADRRPAQGPEGARPAGRDAGRLGRRVRPHADRPGQRRPRPQPVRLHRSGWPAAASRAARSTARPTSTATTPSRTRSRSTTCTPRCCTCWASTTSG